MSGQTLTAARRIRNRPDFERVYKQGIRVHGRFMTLFVLSSDRPTRRLGVAATRKIGAAVERNRAKRLAREIFRRTNSAAGLDIVVVPRREMLDAPFASLEADYERALQRAQRQPRPAAGARGPRHSGPDKGL